MRQLVVLPLVIVVHDQALGGALGGAYVLEETLARHSLLLISGTSVRGGVSIVRGMLSPLIIVFIGRAR